MNTKLMIKAASKTVLGAAVLAAALAAGASAQQEGAAAKAKATFTNSDEIAEGLPVPIVLQGKPVSDDNVRAVDVMKESQPAEPRQALEALPAKPFAFEYEPKTGRTYPEGSGIGLPLKVTWKGGRGAISEAKVLPSDIPMVGGQNAAIVEGVPVSLTARVVPGSPKILKSQPAGGEGESTQDVAVMTFEVARVGQPGELKKGQAARVSISSEGRAMLLPSSEEPNGQQGQ